MNDVPKNPQAHTKELLQLLGKPSYASYRQKHQLFSGAPANADFVYTNEDFLESYTQTHTLFMLLGDTIGASAGRYAEKALPELLTNDALARAKAKELPEVNHFATLRLNGLDEDARFELAADMMGALNERFGLPAALLSPSYVKNDPLKPIRPGDYLLACPHETYVETDGHWRTKSLPQAAKQFYAMALAKGLIDKAGLASQRLLPDPEGNRLLQQHILQLAEQLRAEGIAPILDRPLWSPPERGEGGVLPRASAASRVDDDALGAYGYGDLSQSVSEKPFEQVRSFEHQGMVDSRVRETEL